MADQKTRKPMGLLRFAAVMMLQVETTRMAAALAYRTIFGVIPVVVVGLAFLGAFATEKQVSDIVRRTVDLTGVNRVSLSTRDVSPPPNASPDVPAESEKPTSANAGGAPVPADPIAHASNIEQLIQDLVSRVRRIPFLGIGVVALATFVYAAISMMVEIEKIFNQIYHAPTGRSWARRVTQYWSLITLGSLFLGASFSVSEVIRARLAASTAVNELSGGLGFSAVDAVVFLLTVLISTTLLVIAYTTIPNTRVKLGPAMVGAMFAAVLWESGKWGFAQYVRFSAGSGYAQLYGTIALIPLFLLWVYVTWVIILVGLQISHAIQTHSVVRTRGVNTLEWFIQATRGQAPSSVRDPAAVLAVAAATAERFVAGEPVRPDHLGRATGLEEQAIREILEKLAGAGVLNRVIAGGVEDEPAFSLARPAAEISATEILRVSADSNGPDGAAKIVSEAFNTARMNAVAGKTLADFLPKPAPTPPADPVVTGSSAAAPSA